jgi:hypothetical protein
MNIAVRLVRWNWLIAALLYTFYVLVQNFANREFLDVMGVMAGAGLIFYCGYLKKGTDWLSFSTLVMGILIALHLYQMAVQLPLIDYKELTRVVIFVYYWLASLFLLKINQGMRASLIP